MRREDEERDQDYRRSMASDAQLRRELWAGKRARALKLLAAGTPTRAVAERLGVSMSAVQDWRKYARGGRRER